MLRLPLLLPLLLWLWLLPLPLHLLQSLLLLLPLLLLLLLLPLLQLLQLLRLTLLLLLPLLRLRLTLAPGLFLAGHQATAVQRGSLGHTQLADGARCCAAQGRSADDGSPRPWPRLGRP